MIQALNRSDWDTFTTWADSEGWQVPLQEQHLFLNQWHPYFFVLKEQGEARGFISAVGYRSSAWIGNLLVDPQRRGQGYGTKLLKFALAFLDQPQIENIWLTASEQGTLLYRKYGFSAVDKIERWSDDSPEQHESKANGELDDLIFLDHYCWNESRETLLRNLATDASVLRQGTTMALLQTGLAFYQLGPWLARDLVSRDLRSLLQQARALTPPAKPLICDVLCSAEISMLLQSCGFVCNGSTELMCLSRQPVSYRGVLALASLGSIG
jgi:GNAT superfamily N-acetyltransferase